MSATRTGPGDRGCAATLRVLHRGPFFDEQGECPMATGETGFSDLMFDLVSVQYHSLKAGHDYGQYVRDARNAGHDDVASFFEEIMQEDSRRAGRCHELLRELQAKEDTGSS
jgi:hypothetical protein